MSFSITGNKEGEIGLTSGLYSGQFFLIGENSQGNLNFVQFYNDGAEVAVIAIGRKGFTYTNTSSSFYNRLCTGLVSFGIYPQ